MAAGGAVGLVLGALVCLLTYLGLITIPTRYLFAVTSTLITLLAADMAAQAIAFLQQASRPLPSPKGRCFDRSLRAGAYRQLG
jgi:high-affinity iron transporter